MYNFSITVDDPILVKSLHDCMVLELYFRESGTKENKLNDNLK